MLMMCLRWVTRVAFMALLMGGPLQAEERRVGLDELVSVVKKVLVHLDNGELADLTVGNRNYEFKNADLKVKLVSSVNAGGEIDFVVFTLGADVESSAVQTAKVSLARPPAETTAEQSAEATVKTLVGLIESSFSELSDSLTGEPELFAESLSVSTDFVIATEANGGFKFEFFGFGGEAGGGAASSRAHSITLKMVPKD